MYTPGRYVVPYDVSPEAVASLLIDRLESELLVRYPNSIRTEVPIEDALIIASLIEREAYDFTDMRYISGVIWNRLFIDMRLQLDATLQYAKGSDPYEPAWWPQVKPRDKFLTSDYNTYQNLLTRLFTIEFTFHYDMFLPGLAHFMFPVPLSGHSTHFPRDIHVGSVGKYLWSIK